MQILYYFKEKNTIMDKWQRYHIFDELESHNCYINVYNPLEYSSIEEANEKLGAFITNNNFDLFMTPHGSEDLFIDTLLQVKQQGLPTLLICFDNLIVPFQHRKIAQYFDLVWLTSKETQSMFISWKANVVFNPYAANPNFFKPHYKSEIERIAFIGTPYGSRVNMLNLLTENKINVSLFSNSSSTNNEIRENNKIRDYINPAYNLLRFSIGRRVILGAIKQKTSANNILNINSEYLEKESPVNLEHLGNLYSNFALSLSSTAARNTGVLKKPVNIVNLRSFEIPMSGGLQICSYFEELANYFEEDKEIIFYRSNEEFIEKASFYLKPENKSIRMKLKEGARIRAENDHTWFSRFKKAFDLLGLKYK
jgi:spore maturation protein CgeB